MGTNTKRPLRKNARPLLVLGLLSLVMCGLFFPLFVTGLAQTVFPYQAGGSLAQLPSGRLVGSHYIDNVFTLPVFFHARNESNPANASASGVDPDIPLASALAQVPRISAATGISAANLTALISSNEQKTLWLFGDSYVNVLSLNVALIRDYPRIYSTYD